MSNNDFVKDDNKILTPTIAYHLNICCVCSCILMHLLNLCSFSQKLCAYQLVSHKVLCHGQCSPKKKLNQTSRSHFPV